MNRKVLSAVAASLLALIVGLLISHLRARDFLVAQCPTSDGRFTALVFGRRIDGRIRLHLCIEDQQKRFRLRYKDLQFVDNTEETSRYGKSVHWDQYVLKLRDEIIYDLPAENRELSQPQKMLPRR